MLQGYIVVCIMPVIRSTEAHVCRALFWCNFVVYVVIPFIFLGIEIFICSAPDFSVAASTFL